MNFRGKINSLDIGDKIVDMSITVGNKNFDVSFEVLWDSSSDEFEGWAELAEIVDQNRVDRQGAVMADIKAGQRELTVKYDGGEAYAYGDEAQVDVETENIPGNKMEENKEFDFKKFVAENKLEKNLEKANKEKEGVKEIGPKPKRKHRKNPDRYGRGSHGKIPNFDAAIDSSEPSYPYGVDDPETTSNNASKARSAAKKMGLEPELEKAEYEMHFGRGGGGRRSGEQDPFKYKNSNKRVTKGGKLHKQDLKVAKQDSKRSLDVMRQNKTFKKEKGDFLPESNFSKVDEKLQKLREMDNLNGMTGAEKVLEWYNDYFQTKRIVPTAREIKRQLERAINDENKNK